MEDEFWPFEEVKIPHGDDPVGVIWGGRVLVVCGSEEFRKLRVQTFPVFVFTLDDQSRAVTDRPAVHRSSAYSHSSLTHWSSESSLVVSFIKPQTHLIPSSPIV